MYDVIVIGSGATGAWAARCLAHPGRRVLVVEAGPDVGPEALARLLRLEDPPGDLPEQHRQSLLPGFVPAVAPFLVDDTLHPYTTSGSGDYIWFRSRQLGGRTSLWGGVTPRLSDGDFAGWPFTGEDLAPHYDIVEAAMGVDKDQPPTAAEQALGVAFAERIPGAQVRPRPGVASRPARPDGSGVLWPASASPALFLRDALRAGIELRTDCIVESLALEGENVVGIHVVDRLTHQRSTVRAGGVVLCASSIESSRILLNSRNADHPAGVGNSTDHLGRHLRDHVAVTFLGTTRGFTGPETRSPRGGPFGVYLSIPDRGYQVEGWAQRGPARPDQPARFGLAVSAAMSGDSGNRVTLHPELVDAWGIPIVDISFSFGVEDFALIRRAEDDVHQVCATVGFEITEVDRHYERVLSYVHEVGTARMGVTARESVTDPWNRVWDAPNVLVLDGACWPTNPYPNPTLTMLAIASRACAAYGSS